MSTTVKVWAPNHENEPEGLSNLTSAPKNWFREEPVLAAELYALERWASCEGQHTHVVHVLDDTNTVLRFDVTVTPRREVDVKVNQVTSWPHR